MVLITVILAILSGPIRSQTGPLGPSGASPPSVASPLEFPDVFDVRKERAPRQEMPRRDFPKLKQVDVKGVALLKAELEPNPADDEVKSIAKQKAQALRELANLYEDRLGATGELQTNLAELHAAQKQYCDIAFEIVDTNERKLDVLHIYLNAAIFIENVCADRARAGGPPEAYLAAKSQRLDAQLRIAKFKRSTMANPKPLK